MESQPTSFRGNDLLQGLTAATAQNHYFQRINTSTSPNSLFTATDDYWQYFDYAAYAPIGAGGASGVAMWANLLGTESLSNDFGAAGAVAISLGNPRYRFGFNTTTGLSREHTKVVNGVFIGRFLHETSTTNFNWPQRPAFNEGTAVFAGVAKTPDTRNGNPFDVVNTELSIDSSYGLVEEFDNDSGNGRGGTRTTEDLLLANVHEFKIEIWDDRYGDFVSPSYGNRTPTTNEVVGDYHFSRAINTAVGPWGVSSGAPRDRVFDTWHPGMAIDFDGDDTVEQYEQSPPYIPYEYYPPQTDGTAPQIGPSPATMPNPVNVNRGFWVSGETYAIGDVVFTQWTDGSGATAADSTFQYDELVEPKFAIAYKCIGGNDVDGSGDFQSGTTSPSTTSVGRRTSDGEIFWESIDNRRPLQAVRLTIRFINQKSNLPRQLTLILPLTDP
jgi:hypothetical protein